MYLAFVLLLSFGCDAPLRFLSSIRQLSGSLPSHRAHQGGRVTHLCCRITIHLRNFQASAIKLLLVCFGLPSAIKKLFTYSLASGAMTKILWSRRKLQFYGVFVIAKPSLEYIIAFSYQRLKQSMIIQQNRTR